MLEDFIIVYYSLDKVYNQCFYSYIIYIDSE